MDEYTIKQKIKEKKEELGHIYYYYLKMAKDPEVDVNILMKVRDEIHDYTQRIDCLYLMIGTEEG